MSATPQPSTIGGTRHFECGHGPRLTAGRHHVGVAREAEAPPVLRADRRVQVRLGAAGIVDHGSFDAVPAQDTADVFDQGQVRFRTARAEGNQTFEDVERGGERWLGHMAILERQRSPGTP